MFSNILSLWSYYIKRLSSSYLFIYILGKKTSWDSVARGSSLWSGFTWADHLIKSLMKPLTWPHYWYIWSSKPSPLRSSLHSFSPDHIIEPSHEVSHLIILTESLAKLLNTVSYRKLFFFDHNFDDRPNQGWWIVHRIII